MRAIIFGAHGQDGFYLEQLLKQKQIDVISTSRNGYGHIVKGDVGDKQFVESLINNYKPEYIFNLAANSSTHHDLLFENHETIASGTLNILDATYKFSKGSKIFLCGSGLQFVNNEVGIKESDAFEARDVYSIARIQSVYAARYFMRLGLDIYIGYLFNHDSPLRSPRHVNQKIAQSARQIFLKKSQHLELGNIEVVKEFSFAGDVVNAIWILVNNNQGIREAVIGSGKGYSIRYWTELCFKYYGLNWMDYIETNTGYKSEYRTLVSDPKTIMALGWRPTMEIEQLCRLFCDKLDEEI